MLALTVALVGAASPLEAQGIVDVIIPNSRGNPEAVWRAKVRDSVTTALQKWARSLEQRDTSATASAYASNARSIIGDEPEATTPSAVVSQLYKSALAGSYVDLSVTDFDMSGDLAFVSVVMLTPGTGADALPTSMRSLFVFKFDAWHNRWLVRQQFIDLPKV